MQAVWSAVINVYAALAVVPYVSFFAVWTVVFLAARNKKKATRTAMDVTFVLLIGSVFVLLRQTTGSGALFWVLVFFLLLTAGLVGREQNRRHGRVDPVKVVKFVSRSGFLLFSAMYIGLTIVSIFRFAVAG